MAISRKQDSGDDLHPRKSLGFIEIFDPDSQPSCRLAREEPDEREYRKKPEARAAPQAAGTMVPAARHGGRFGEAKPNAGQVTQLLETGTRRR